MKPLSQLPILPLGPRWEHDAYRVIDWRVRVKVLRHPKPVQVFRDDAYRVRWCHLTIGVSLGYRRYFWWRFREESQ
jgi:hypothetical protein